MEHYTTELAQRAARLEQMPFDLKQRTLALQMEITSQIQHLNQMKECEALKKEQEERQRAT
jgi:hypothetical protein